MLREHHRVFQSAQVLRDTLAAWGAFWLAFFVRFHTDLLPFATPANQRESVVVGFLVLAVWPAVAWISNLYTSHRTRPLLGEVFDTFKAVLVAFLLLVTVTYFLRDERYSRSVMGLWFPLSFVTVTAVRLASRVLLRRLRTRGYNLRHVVVVGTGALARRVIAVVRERNVLGLRVVGLVAHSAAAVGSHIDGVPVLAAVDQLGDLLARRREEGSGVDQVIVALPVEELGSLRGIMRVLSRDTVDVRLIPDVYQYITLCGSVEEFAGMPLINLQATSLVGWHLFVKRVFDMGVATLALILTAPLMLGVSLAVRWSSPGPVFFRQVRVGMDGRPFTMLKFRTMRSDAEADGAKMTQARDPRRTTLGRLLRYLSVDELPQLFNVLRGDMSLVGPRPEQPAFIESFTRDIPRYALRHKIKAGMTGLAQINGLRGNTSMHQRIELDLYYIENWSLGLDLRILMRTVLGGFLSRHAY